MTAPGRGRPGLPDPAAIDGSPCSSPCSGASSGAGRRACPGGSAVAASSARKSGAGLHLPDVEPRRRRLPERARHRPDARRRKPPSRSAASRCTGPRPELPPEKRARRSRDDGEGAMFEPIAITASASVLPGARSVEELWAAVAEARDLTSDAAEDAWGAASVRVLGARAYAEIDAAACKRGGYVTGFDAAFDPEGFGIDPARSMALDPAFRWLLHCGRQALDAAGIGRDARRGRPCC